MMKLTPDELQQIKTIGVDCPTTKECDALIKKCYAILLMNTENGEASSTDNTRSIRGNENDGAETKAPDQNS